MCGICRDRAGTWALVALAAYPSGQVVERVVASAADDPARFGLRAGGAMSADAGHVVVEIAPDGLWPCGSASRWRGRGAATAVLGVAHWLPGIGQYWHPHLLAGRADGEPVLADERIVLADARVRGEELGGAFRGHWWWGRGPRLHRRPRRAGGLRRLRRPWPLSSRRPRERNRRPGRRRARPPVSADRARAGRRRRPNVGALRARSALECRAAGRGARCLARGPRPALGRAARRPARPPAALRRPNAPGPEGPAGSRSRGRRNSPVSSTATAVRSSPADERSRARADASRRRIPTGIAGLRRPRATSALRHSNAIRRKRIAALPVSGGRHESSCLVSGRVARSSASSRLLRVSPSL